MEDVNLHYLLNPRSLAIVGISRNPDSFGYPFVEIAQKCGYTGNLYLINPNAETILGLKCYPSILDVPGEVDAAMIMVSKKYADQAVDDCISKGVKGIVMITAGFAEQGADGRKRQDELVRKANVHGIRMIGPNTLGYYSASVSLDAIMSGFIKAGHTALISQSGNLTQSLTFPGSQRGLGFRYVVGLGNQADVQAYDLIRYFRNDPDTRAIAIHIEGLKDGRRFMEEVRETVRVKPVLVVKSGRTEKGAKVASSHTAAIAGNDSIYQAALRQCGAIMMETFSGLTSALLAFNQRKPMKGNRVCIISEGGGDCAWTSDACICNGLEVPELSIGTQEYLKPIIPPNGSVSNPVDLAGWENFVEATGAALADDGIDGVILVGGFGGNFHINPRDYNKEKECVERMLVLLADAKKPVLIYSYSGYKQSIFVDMLKEQGIPLFFDHHDAVKAMAALARFHNIQTATIKRSRFESALPLFDPDRDAVARPLLATEAKQLLRKYNISFPAEGLARNDKEAVELAHTIGFPVALKIVSQDILHKSDVGCVKLNLNDEEAVELAFAEIEANARQCKCDANISGILVSKMDTYPGTEVIIGGVNDQIFGPVVMFGLGGIFVEILKDVAFRVCPLSEADAEEMIREIKGFPVLAGARGGVAVDLGAIKHALLSVSQLLIENRQIQEIDLNPIKVHAKGLNALDARMIVSGAAQ
ncbi:MAG: acetate--CoA ligase family protein [Kiritimatiellales bacterium]